MHWVRKSVRENRLSDRTSITHASYVPYVRRGSAWIAETDLGIAGFAAVNSWTSRVWALFVHPNFEHTGIGRALHSKMIDWAQEQGIDQLTLSTHRESRAAGFYAQAGWTQASVTSDGEAFFQKTLRA